MALFSAATLEQVRAANDIVEVIGAYFPLKRAGGGFVALCPFHKEKTPSFNVNPHKQIFHCFGCGKGGNVFTFVQEYESLDFPEAVRRLAERAKIPLVYEAGGGGQVSRDLKQTLLQIHEQITQRWQTALANEASGQIARNYLAKRGVSAEAIQLFRLGYAPELWDDTVNWAKNKGYEPALVEKAGLILRKEETQHYYDRFRGRLMFPICDEQGRVIGFSGRVLSGDEKTAKYVNSPETPIFFKSRIFFGLDKSKRAMLDAGVAVVCEGQLDLIACFMGGVQNIVAPQGTAFTAEHARILKRYVEEVVLCFDSDEAGQNAATRALDSLLAAGLAVRVAVVPAPHDPDSFIKESGGEAFKRLVQQAPQFFDYYLGRLCALNDVTTDKGRLEVVRSMAAAVHKTGDGVLIDKYAQQTAGHLRVLPDAVRAEFKKLSQVRGLARGEAEQQTKAAEEAPVRLAANEDWLLKLLLSYEELVPWVADYLDPAWVQNALARQIISQRLAVHAQQSWRGLPAFLAECEIPELRTLITEATAVERPVPNPAQVIADTVKRLRDASIDRELTALLVRAAKPELGDAERVQLLRRQQELRQVKRQPLAKRERGGAA
jgi:DNA primase